MSPVAVRVPARPLEARGLRQPGLAVIGAVVALNLLPLIWFEYIPTSDGPSHVYNAVLIRDALLGYEWALRAFESVEFAPGPVPNWTGHAFIAAASLVLEPAAAERLLIGAWILLLPGALLYAIRSVTTRADGLALCACPFAYGSHLHWGFYNFLLSLGFFLLIVGYWLRHADRMTPSRACVLAALSLLTYLSNLVSVAQLLLWMGVLTAFRLAARQPGARRTAAAAFAAVGPAVVAWVTFWWTSPGGHAVDFPAAVYAAANLLRLDLLGAFHSSAERTVAVLFAVALWGTAGVVTTQAVLARRTQGMAFLVLAAVCALVVFIAPSSAGGGTLLTPRQVVFVVFATVLWMAAAQTRTRAVIAPLAWSAAVASVSLLLLQWGALQRYDATLQRFVRTVAGAELRGARTLLSVPPANANVDVIGDRRAGVTVSGSAAGYVAASLRLVWLDSYEWRTSHFPLRARQPIEAADGASWVPSPGGTIDAVLAWGDGRQRAEALVARLNRENADVRLERRPAFAGVYGTPVLYRRAPVREPD